MRSSVPRRCAFYFGVFAALCFGADGGFAQTPGGWRIIGRTPVSLYQPTSSPPFLFSPGDTVEFYPIDVQEFTRMAYAAPT